MTANEFEKLLYKNMVDLLDHNLSRADFLIAITEAAEDMKTDYARELEREREERA